MKELIQNSLFSEEELGGLPRKVEVVYHLNPLQEEFVKETGLPCFFDHGSLINPEYLAWCERRINQHGSTD